MLNEDVSRVLSEVADLLEEQGANPFRIQAHRRAAGTIAQLDRPVDRILQTEGIEGLVALPGIGQGLAGSIREYLLTLRLPVLDRLRGESDPVAVLTSVAGIGETLATRLHEELGIDSLEDLESASHDGRLDRIKGFGERRRAQVVAALEARLGRHRRSAPPRVPASIAEILEVDREYREKAAAGALRRIAPRRLNPRGDAWLPILHTDRDDRHYTALFSNTPRAHQLGKTRDWVIIHQEGEGHEAQYTVVTGQWGRLRGRRTVRGRETECLDFYREAAGSNLPMVEKVPT